MYKTIYFSPTGNVKHLATTLSKNLGDSEAYPLEFTDYDTLKDAEHIIIMFAIHGFNSPRTVNRFVKNMPVHLSAKISIISIGCTDIWINKAASLKVKKQLINKGYNIIIDEQLNMPLTIATEFPVDYSRRIIEESTKKIIKISNQIKNSEVSNNIIPNKSRILTILGKLEDPAARLFGLELYANKSCTSCGKCVDQCPEKNISMGKNSRPKFGFKCLMCMRCIYDCPEQSIKPRISRFIPIKGGYKLHI